MTWEFGKRLNRLDKIRNEEVERFDRAAKIAEETNFAHSDRNHLLSKEWFEASEALLKECRLWISKQPSGTSIADEGLARIEGILHHLSQGLMPDPIRLATLKDGNPMWPGERHDIAMAVFYAQAAKRGEISDRKHNKTIRNLYSVDDSTVRRWIRGADEICANITQPEASKLSNAIQIAGQRYSTLRTGRKNNP